MVDPTNESDETDHALIRLFSADGEQAGRVSSALLPLVYDELRHLASRRLQGDGAGQTLQPTALVHEAWLRLTSVHDRLWESKAHFFRAATRAMRRILVDRARAKSRKKRQGCQDHVGIDQLEILDSPPDDRVLLVEDALKKLEMEDPELARLVALKFYGGLTDEEISSVEGISDRTVRRRWEYARVKMYHIIRESIL